MKKTLFLMIFVSVLLSCSSIAFSDETSSSEDVQIAGGFDLGELLSFGSGLIALILFALTVTAYKRSKNTRLVYVSIAFLLFSINGFLASSQLLFSDWAWIDPITNVLNFAILISFFFGILKK